MALDESTIAHFRIDRDPARHLGGVLRELDRALDRAGLGPRRMVRDDADTAFLEIGAIRFTLRAAAAGSGGSPGWLVMSVGPIPDRADATTAPHQDAEGQRLCARIADILRERLAPHRTQLHQVAGPVTPDLVDALFDRLPSLPDDRATRNLPARAPSSRTAAPAHPFDMRRTFPETVRPGANDLPPCFAEKSLLIRAAKAARRMAAPPQALPSA